MKIGDKVKICTVTAQLDGIISGEVEDGRSAGVWLVDCPEREIREFAFRKDEMDGKFYSFGNHDVWIVPNPENIAEVVEIVNNWLNDDSGYDQQAYPEIKQALIDDGI
jgi:hypothetical protein